MPSRLTGFVCPTVSMVTTGHATGVEKTLLHPLGYLDEVPGPFPPRYREYNPMGE